MNTFVSAIKQLTGVGELVLIGLRSNLLHFESLYRGAKGFNIIAIDHPDVLRNWLNHIQRNGLPYAIIADYQFLSDRDFHHLKVIRSIAILDSIPIIGIREKYQLLNLSSAQREGMDDCLLTDVSWILLKGKIEFFRRLKKRKVTLPFEWNLTGRLKISRTKRAFDILVASLGLILLSPLFVLIAIAIRLESSGPIIYRSKRAGMGYHIFDFFKFRSMYKEADQRLNELQHLNQYQSGKGSCFIKLRNDPRVTRVGRFIRKTSLDELPQLFNVLRGDMSLVGNRPLPLYEAEQLVREEWINRFKAPAGITGLWQVTKKGKDPMSNLKRIYLDLEYASKSSFLFDLGIVMKTLPAMIQNEND